MDFRVLLSIIEVIIIIIGYSVLAVQISQHNKFKKDTLSEINKSKNVIKNNLTKVSAEAAKALDRISKISTVSDKDKIRLLDLINALSVYQTMLTDTSYFTLVTEDKIKDTTIKSAAQNIKHLLDNLEYLCSEDFRHIKLLLAFLITK